FEPFPDVWVKPHNFSHVKVWYFRKWVEESLANRVRNTLECITEWVETGTRQVKHMGDTGVTYTYSGKRYKTERWEDSILEVRDILNSKFKVYFNIAVINHYRNGNDSLGWHSDSEKEILKGRPIVSVSFGETREMAFRWKGEHTIVRRCSLEERDMLAMLDDTQNVVEHRILQDSKRLGERFNITFRWKEVSEVDENIIKHSEEQQRSKSFPRDKMIDDEDKKDERYKTERVKEEIRKTKIEAKKKDKEAEGQRKDKDRDSKSKKEKDTRRTRSPKPKEVKE